VLPPRAWAGIQAKQGVAGAAGPAAGWLLLLLVVVRGAWVMIRATFLVLQMTPQI
jgi:hypothetical protein